MPKKVALIAHDEKKADLVAFVTAHQAWFSTRQMVATGTTGSLVKAACPSLDVTLFKSGPLGGDQQIGALIAEGEIDLLIFFVDPLTPMPHDVDVKALMRSGSAIAIGSQRGMKQNRLMRGARSTAEFSSDKSARQSSRGFCSYPSGTRRIWSATSLKNPCGGKHHGVFSPRRTPNPSRATLDRIAIAGPSIVYDVGMALNRASAELILRSEEAGGQPVGDQA